MASRDVDDRVERLIEMNAHALLAFFMRRTAQPEDAADLLGDTLLVIWRKARSLPADDGEARMWMFGVARNVLSTQRRGQRRRDALQERLRSELSVVTIRQGDDHPELGVALSRLDPLDQEIIRLVHWDGFTQVQAAHLLDIEEGTVRSRHHRARQRLRSLLDGSTTSS